LAAALLSLAGCTGQGHKAPSTSITAAAGLPLNEFDKIYDWRADGSAGIYIQTDRRNWYHATFVAPCENLPFTEHVDVHNTPGQSLDRFDSIEVRGEDCYFKTIEPVAGPPVPAAATPKKAKP